MLKIKDNVNLKELEKFGFEDDKKYCYTYTAAQIIHRYRSGGKKQLKRYSQKDSITVDKKSREIRMNYHIKDTGEELCGASGCIEDIDVLYDLQEAGLVEKVVDE